MRLNDRLVGELLLENLLRHAGGGIVASDLEFKRTEVSFEAAIKPNTRLVCQSRFRGAKLPSKQNRVMSNCICSAPNSDG